MMKTDSNSSIIYTVLILLEEDNEDFAQFVQNLYDLFAARGQPFEILIFANGKESFLKDELLKLHNSFKFLF